MQARTLTYAHTLADMAHNAVNENIKLMRQRVSKLMAETSQAADGDSKSPADHHMDAAEVLDLRACIHTPITIHKNAHACAVECVKEYMFTLSTSYALHAQNSCPNEYTFSCKVYDMYRTL